MNVAHLLEATSTHTLDAIALQDNDDTRMYQATERAMHAPGWSAAE